MSERNIEQSNVSWAENYRNTLDQAREHALSVAGALPDALDYDNPGEYDEACRNYWDKYYEACYNFLDKSTSSSGDDNTNDFLDLDSQGYDLDNYEYPENENMGNTSERGSFDEEYEIYRRLILDLYEREARLQVSEGRRFFPFSEARKEVYEFSKAIAEYLHSKKIKNLVIADRSSRPLYVGVMEYWKEKFGDEQRPGLYFINPKGFKNHDTTSVMELIKSNDQGAGKGDPHENIRNVKTKEEVMTEFQKVYPKLLADKDSPVLLFDTCIHSGNTLYSVVEIMKEMGFKDIRIGAVNPTEPGSKINADFYITHKSPENGCYPFDRDRMIEKTFEHVYSKRSNDQQKRAYGIALRQEIKRIIQENLQETK